MIDELLPAVFLMGPTATGKTAMAVELVRRFPCDIISVDSALVYRGMDIGTAKPDAGVLRTAPHRLIDIRDPAVPYSAAEFREDALREMADIAGRGRVPLLVGGTMLYYRALEQGLSELPAADSEIRARLEAEGRRDGWAVLHRRLAQVDPAAAARIKPTDPQRIQRALEVHELTGQPISVLHARGRSGPLPYRVLKLALLPGDREILHARIEARFRSMLAAGFVAEVRTLFERGDLDSELPALRAVGYRQVWDYLAGKIDYDGMVEQAIVVTRQYAKRQMTWLRSEPSTDSFVAGDAAVIDRIAAKIAAWLEK